MPGRAAAITYRLEAHTNADDATRYRSAHEVDAWRARDPVTLLEQHLRAAGLLDEARATAVAREAEELAARMRAQFDAAAQPDPDSLFTHVYAEPTAQLREQAADLAARLAADADYDDRDDRDDRDDYDGGGA
jgi:2-oxoisovalerate dehydrogenase E1 component alpha subunit